MISAHVDWWKNPTNVMRGAELHSKDHPTLYRYLKRRLGHSLKFYTGSVIRLGRRLLINVLELKAVSLDLRSFKDQCQNQTVLVAMDNSTVRAYINKPDGANAVELCALLWSHYGAMLSHNIENQTHSKVRECDG